MISPERKAAIEKLVTAIKESPRARARRLRAKSALRELILPKCRAVDGELVWDQT